MRIRVFKESVSTVNVCKYKRGIHQPYLQCVQNTWRQGKH